MTVQEAASRHSARRLGVAILAGLSLAPAAALARDAATPEAAQNAIAIVEDPLERETILSTEPVARSTRGVFATAHNDGYLLAAVDRTTGKVRFEVRQTFNYDGPYRQYERVAYEGVETPGAASLDLLETNAEHCQAFDSGTACREVAAFAIPEADLRSAAQGSGGHHPEAWELKFKPRNGHEHRAQLPRAEILGLLRAVEGYRASRLAAAQTSIAR